MRTIKFRAYDTYSQAWLNDKISIALSGKMLYEGRPADSEDALGNLAGNVILEQFTGLLDKNGKEIYEGDIVKGHTVWGDEHGNEEVDDAWQVSEVKVVLDKFEGYKFSVAFLNLDAVEVIGNIHENPELLTTR